MKEENKQKLFALAYRQALGDFIGPELVALADQELALGNPSPAVVDVAITRPPYIGAEWLLDGWLKAEGIANLTREDAYWWNVRNTAAQILSDHIGEFFGAEELYRNGVEIETRARQEWCWWFLALSEERGESWSKRTEDEIRAEIREVATLLLETSFHETEPPPASYIKGASEEKSAPMPPSFLDRARRWLRENMPN